jgi:glyoxylase-like metal-dependent hydrolase (beta-lactamase superfamily II)
MNHSNNHEIKCFVSGNGVTIYRLPVTSFPGHVTNCYLALGDPLTLIDAGSGWANANNDLLACFSELRDRFGEVVTLADVRRLMITHGHIDHFGGLNFVLQHSSAQVGIHELDTRVLCNFEERQIIISKDLQIFLERAGLAPSSVEGMVEMNKWSKDVFKSASVDFTLNESALLDRQFRVYHTPGHCPGQVCLQLDDVLFTADHVLSHITPLQSPEFITRYTGLGHYLESLQKIRRIPGIQLGLGGHEDEIQDLAARIDEIQAFHHERLNQVLDICREPKTIKQISRELFHERIGYQVLLALLETGAHVEYLYQRGKLGVLNIEEVEREPNPPLLYQRL